jgi:hypothetical protein
MAPPTGNAQRAARGAAAEELPQVEAISVRLIPAEDDDPVVLARVIDALADVLAGRVG